MRHTRLLTAVLTVFSLCCAAQGQCAGKIQLNALGIPEPDRISILEKLQKSRCCSQAALSDKALEMAKNLGFLKAALEPAPVGSTCTISIVPGIQYYFGGFTVRGERSLDKDRIQSSYALRPGDLASKRLLSQTLDNIRKAYGQVGLRDTVIVPIVHFNDKTRVVTFDLEIHEDGR